MRALVTGADGFIGQHLVAELLSHEYTVAASVLTLPPQRTTLSAASISAVEWKAADVRDHDALYRLLAATRPDVIYHLAGFSSGSLAGGRVAEAITVNVGGTVNLCEAVLTLRAEAPEFDPRIMVMGSAYAYGDADSGGEPISEESPLRPVSAYGLSKAAQELAAHTYRRSRGLRIVVVRAFNLIGPGQELPFVIPDFCAQVGAIAARRADPVIRVGNVHVERDFTDVRDGASAFRMAMEQEQPRAAYNVATGVPTRIGTLLEWILDEAGLEAEIRTEPARVRREEPLRMTGDPGRLAEDTGWRPERSIEDTVREVYRGYAGGRQQREPAAHTSGER